MKWGVGVEGVLGLGRGDGTVVQWWLVGDGGGEGWWMIMGGWGKG